MKRKKIGPRGRRASKILLCRSVTEHNLIWVFSLSLAVSDNNDQHNADNWKQRRWIQSEQSVQRPVFTEAPSAQEKLASTSSLFPHSQTAALWGDQKWQSSQCVAVQSASNLASAAIPVSNQSDWSCAAATWWWIWYRRGVWLQPWAYASECSSADIRGNHWGTSRSGTEILRTGWSIHRWSVEIFSKISGGSTIFLRGKRQLPKWMR